MPVPMRSRQIIYITDVRATKEVIENVIGTMYIVKITGELPFLNKTMGICNM